MRAVVTIRPETGADTEAIHDVVAAAFNSENEAQLVAKIRASEHFVAEWSLVAVDDTDTVVGHVMVSYVALVDGATRHRVPSLSPLAVAPPQHRNGIGSALVRAVTALVDDAGEPFVVLEGDPRYYSRLGFEFAPKYGVHLHLPSWAPPEAAQLLPLHNYNPACKGQIEYPPAFDDVTDA